MAFKDTILTFEDDKIVTDDDREVMMSWEAPIMEKSAEYICQSKGDILEIGFGMGICSDYIQAQGVNSHTIVEIHPQVIEKLKVWADDKPNVTINSSMNLNANSLSLLFLANSMLFIVSFFRTVMILSSNKYETLLLFHRNHQSNLHVLSSVA